MLKARSLRRRASRAQVVKVLAVVAATAAFAPPGRAVAFTSPAAFAVDHVTAVDNKTLDVVFNDTLALDVQQMLVANPNALLQYTHVSGGTAAQPDALLDGRALTTTTATAQVKAVAAKDTLEIVFTGTAANAITLQPAGAYTLWLDATSGTPTTLAAPATTIAGGSIPVATASSTASAATAAGATNVKVGAVIGLFAPGQTISIDTGANAETAVIASVGTTGASGTGLTLTAPLTKAHASAAAVAVIQAAGATSLKIGGGTGSAVTGFLAGQTVSIDTGANAETAVIASVGTMGIGGSGLTLTAPLTKAHNGGVAVATVTAAGVTNLKLASVLGLVEGQTLAIDTGAGAETAVIAAGGVGSAGADGTGVTLTAPTTLAHSGAATVTAPISAGTRVIKAASLADFAAGDTLSIDSGASQESATVASVGTNTATGTGIALTAPLAKAHAAGAALSLSARARSLGSLLFTSASGSALTDDLLHQTARYTFAGTAATPALAAITTAQFLDSRKIRVTFNQPILAGMAFHTYTAGRITLTTANPAATISPRYVDLVPNTSKTQYDLYLPSDAPATADSYTLSILANPNSTSNTATLQTSAGLLPSAATALTTTLTAPTATHAEPGISSITVNSDRNAITVNFNSKLDRLTLPGAVVACQAPQSGSCLNPLAVRESSNGIAGLVLSKAQLLQTLSFSGLQTEDGGDLVDALRDQPAWFPDAKSMVITLRDAYHLKRAATGSITLTPGRIVDKTLKADSDPNTAVPVSVGDQAASSPNWDPNGPDYLTQTDGQVVFRDFDYRLAASTPSNMTDIVNAVPDRTVDQTFPSIVVDNKYVKATFVPTYGGRMLSLVYKPTGNDLLYKNPVGTPYQIGNTTFYYHWLQVFGGIMPTFVESEHGKFWNQPWNYSVTNTADATVVKEWITDNISENNSNFSNGPTGLTLTVTYTVHKNSPVVDMGVSIHNPNTVTKNFEYWTCTTVAPGENPAGNYGSPTMQIVAPVTSVTRDSSYGWMDGVDAGTGTTRQLTLANLPYIYDWMANGIAYGNNLNTGTQKGWWGVVNHETDQGILRIAASQGGTQTQTIGMKYWTWGFEPSYGTGDANSFSNPSPLTPGNLGANDVAAPGGSNRYVKGDSPAAYIELWAGLSPAFHTPTTIAPDQTIDFTDQFMPTMDLANMTNANGQGAANVTSTLKSGSAATVTADVWSTHIGQPLTAKLIDMKTGRTVTTKSFTGSAYDSVRLTGTMAGNRVARLELDDATGASLLTADKAVDASVPDDTAPPATTASYAPSTPACGGSCVAITSASKITLSAIDDIGVAGTEYRVDGGAWTAYSGPFSLSLSGGTHTLEYRSTDVDGNVEPARSQTVLIWPTVDSPPSGTVPATLSLTLGAPASFGAFTPGLTKDYSASMTANVISTAGDATLSVADPSATATGHLVNGAFSLPSVLQAKATSAASVGGAFANVGGSAAPTTLLTYAGPASNDGVTVSFLQHVGSTDALRTGSYSKTLTFTLSTTTP
jgi:hypothetical protein